MSKSEKRHKTEIFSVSPTGEPASAIMAAARILRDGGLVAFPTETVYGLGATALDADAVADIFIAKQRPLNDPLIVHIADRQQINTVAASLPPIAWSLIDHFWPGPLTLIVPRAASIPAIVSAGGATVGIRMPSHPIALALLRAAGVPIAAPSANRFMHTSPTTAAHVLADLDGRIAAILDAGPTSVGVESTVLDVLATPPRILRPGGVTLEALQELIPEIEAPAIGITSRTDEDTEDAMALAPGQLERHYAPHTRLIAFDARGERALQAIRVEAEQALVRGKRVGVLLADGEEAAIRGLPVAVEWLGPADELESISQRLYAALRELDSKGLDCIITHTFGRAGMGLALWDRLRRAAGGRFQPLPE